MASESEKPFGNLYSQADYNFLAAVNDIASRKFSPDEQAQASFIVREELELIGKEKEDRYEKIIDEIERVDGIEVKSSGGETTDKLFVLTAPPIEMAIIQGERRTKINFNPNPQMRYNPYYFYGLFFDEIPKALYGTGREAPEASHIRQSTLAAIQFKNSDGVPYDLQKPSEKEQFEKKMENLDDVDYVEFVCDGQGVSYSMVLPNPNNANNNYIKFSFPSKIPLTQETVGIFLEMHKDGWKLNGENQSYAKSFTSAINRIREELRVR